MAATRVVVGPASVVDVAVGGAARSAVAGVAASVVVDATGGDVDDDTVDRRSCAAAARAVVVVVGRFGGRVISERVGTAVEAVTAVVDVAAAPR